MDELDREFALHEAIRKILREESEAENPLITSEDVYDKLIERGIEPAPHAMARFYDRLKREGMVRGVIKHNTEAAQKHGAFAVSWVNPFL